MNTQNISSLKGQDLIDQLSYISYRHNRDLGMSHESLVRIGLGTSQMDQAYKKEKLEELPKFI